MDAQGPGALKAAAPGHRRALHREPSPGAAGLRVLGCPPCVPRAPESRRVQAGVGCTVVSSTQPGR